MAAYATDPDVVVLTGRVVAVDHDQRGTFRVERWYKGGGIAVDIPIQGGDGANCGIRLTAGDHLVMVAFFSDNVLSSSICSPSGDLATHAGRQLEQDAVHTFGEGWLPGRHAGGPIGPTAEVAGTSWIGVLVAAGTLVILVILAIALYRRSRRSA